MHNYVFRISYLNSLPQYTAVCKQLQLNGEHQDYFLLLIDDTVALSTIDTDLVGTERKRVMSTSGFCHHRV